MKINKFKKINLKIKAVLQVQTTLKYFKIKNKQKHKI